MTSFRKDDETPVVALGSVEPPTTTNKICNSDDDTLLSNSITFGEWRTILESRKKSQEKTTSESFFYRIFMSWLNPVIKIAWRKKTLTRFDLPKLPSGFLASSLYPSFAKQFEKWNAKSDRPFQRALFSTPQVRRTLLIGSFFSSMQGLLTTVGRPLVLKLVVEMVSEGTDFQTSVGLVVAVAAIILLEGLSGVFGRQLLAEEFGTQFFVCSNGAVYNKMMKIDTTFVDSSSETNLLSNDVIRCYENIRTFSNLPMALSGVVGGVAVLLYMVGLPGLIGCAIMFTILLLNMFLGNLSHHFEQKNLIYADERLGMLTSLLHSPLAVKLFGWEDQYYKNLTDIREQECNYIRKYRLSHVLSIVSGRFSPVLSAMVTLIYFTMVTGKLELSLAYATVSVFQALRLSLIFVPLCITSLMAFDVTLKRLNTYFKREDFEKGCYYEDDQNIEQKPLLEMQNCDLGWIPSSPPTLENVSLTVNRNETIAVVGSVGSGKTTLLSTIAQMLPCMKDESGNTDTGIISTRKVAMVPQKSFIVSGTIKQNIVLGRSPFDEDRFIDAIQRSGLLFDIEHNFCNGIATEIGERGNNLSGGQCARIGVARALYGDPDLLIMDDSLAAVSADACKLIFQRAVMDQKSSSKSVVIAMNQIGLLPQVDRIVFLHEGAVIQGSYADLVNSCPAFCEFISSTTLGENGGEDEDEIVLEDIDDFDRERIFRRRIQHNNDKSILNAESLTTGNISSNVYLIYIKSLGVVFFIVCIVLCVIGYGLMALNDFWLTLWSEALQDENSRGNGFYIGIYTSLSLGFAFCILTVSCLLCFGGVRASKALHNTMLAKLLHAPMHWYEETNAGRILSRFSSDLAKVDMILTLAVDNFLQILITLLVLLTTICLGIPIMIAVVVVALVVFAFLIQIMDRTSRLTRRVCNDCMSPLLSNIVELSKGRQLIKVFGSEGFFLAKHRLVTDEYSRSNLTAGSLINYCVLLSSQIAFVISIVSACLLVILNQGNNQLLGLSLTYSFLIPYFMATTSQVWIRMNSFFTSFERLLEYEKLPAESQVQPDAVAIDYQGGDENWPSKGAISFEKVCMRYRDELPLVLKGVSFAIPGGTTCALVGASGSGKSSTINCLFRVNEIESGCISIDGKNIAGVPLKELRKSLTIVPQEPILYVGSIRSQLDPFHERDDAALLNVLDLVGLSELSLDSRVDHQGKNFSFGERQLLCFARALLDDTKILICDEPTSACDLQTDEFIQDMIRTQFLEAKKCTVVMIAHRIDTIIDFERIIVMDKGTLSEMGTPKSLFLNKDSFFNHMLEALPPTSRATITNKLLQHDH